MNINENIYKKDILVNRFSNFDSINKTEDSDNEADIELYAESEQIINFKNSMIDLNFTNVIKNQDFLQESYKDKMNFNEKVINDRILNKNNSDIYLNNNILEKEFNSPYEQKGFNKLIKRKNSAGVVDEKDGFYPHDKMNNFNKDKINVHQSAMANQFKIKIGDIDLNDHFFEEKIITLEEENKNLRERLENVFYFLI